MHRADPTQIHAARFLFGRVEQVRPFAAQAPLR
jgi:hypothetical protein